MRIIFFYFSSAVHTVAVLTDKMIVLSTYLYNFLLSTSVSPEVKIERGPDKHSLPRDDLKEYILIC